MWKGTQRTVPVSKRLSMIPSGLDLVSSSPGIQRLSIFFRMRNPTLQRVMTDGNTQSRPQTHPKNVRFPTPPLSPGHISKKNLSVWANGSIHISFICTHCAHCVHSFILQPRCPPRTGPSSHQQPLYYHPSLPVTQAKDGRAKLPANASSHPALEAFPQASPASY